MHNPALPDDDFNSAVAIAQQEFDRHQPDVVVGASRGGALAMNIRSGTAPLVLLCPAWKRWGKATRAKGRSWILHSRGDDVVAYADSELLVKASGLGQGQMIETGEDHRLADKPSLEAMWQACQRSQDAQVGVTVYYLEMRCAPADPAPPAPVGARVLEVAAPTVDYYRFLYNAVGSDYHWESRGAVTDKNLEASIRDPRNVLYVLHVEGAPAGYAELDLRLAGEVELVQFGLFPGYLGRGLGPWFLSWIVEKVWAGSPSRFWLHTCTLDHPAAVPTYVRQGFTQYAEEHIQRTLPPTNRSST